MRRKKATTDSRVALSLLTLKKKNMHLLSFKIGPWRYLYTFAIMEIFFTVIKSP